MTFLMTALALILASAVLIHAVRRSLLERPLARKYRASFTAIASDLVAKAEFPDEHANQLVMLSAIRSGWLTRFMVMMLVRKVFVGVRPVDTRAIPKLAAVPEELRPRYVVALLSAVLADSYYSLLLGPVWRAANSWVVDALEGIKPDVNAHATQVVIRQVWNVPVRAPHLTSGLPEACLA